MTGELGADTLAASGGALLDTSVLVAAERGEKLAALSEVARPAVSVITLAELKAGVAASTGTPQLLRRMRTLDAARSLIAYDIDEGVADAWVILRSHLAATGRRLGANDLWIASTALAKRLPLITRDGDFDALEGVGDLRVLRISRDG